MDVNVHAGPSSLILRVINMTDGDRQSVKLHLHIDLHSHQHVIMASRLQVHASRSYMCACTYPRSDIS